MPLKYCIYERYLFFSHMMVLTAHKEETLQNNVQSFIRNLVLDIWFSFYLHVLILSFLGGEIGVSQHYELLYLAV